MWVWNVYVWLIGSSVMRTFEERRILNANMDKLVTVRGYRGMPMQRVFHEHSPTVHRLIDLHHVGCR
jgi:hypothetical protein